jgi:integrase
MRLTTDGSFATPRSGSDFPGSNDQRLRFLDHGQVDDLADACGCYALFIRTLAYTGLRWGEATALRVRNVDLADDLARGRLNVVEAATQLSGKITMGTPKSHQNRSVPVPAFLVSELARHLEGRGLDELVFTAPEGGPLRNSNFRRRVFDPAALRVGLKGLRPHDLRHTAASLAIASGADVQVVQQMLGHASAAMTLDIYAGLFQDRLDDVAERLHDAATRARTASVKYRYPHDRSVPVGRRHDRL